MKKTKRKKKAAPAAAAVPPRPVLPAENVPELRRRLGEIAEVARVQRLRPALGDTERIHWIRLIVEAESLDALLERRHARAWSAAASSDLALAQ